MEVDGGLNAGRHKGAVAIEFAFVFPILFLLMYGIVVYGYVFVLNSALHYAAQEAAASAVRVDPNASDANSLRAQRARNTVRATLNWLPRAQLERVMGAGDQGVDIHFCPGAPGAICPPDIGGATGAIVVELIMPLADPPLFPRLTLPLVGTVPPLPNQLRTQAVARI